MANKQTDSGATTGYEAELWAMAERDNPALKDVLANGSMSSNQSGENVRLDAAIAENLNVLGFGGRGP